MKMLARVPRILQPGPQKMGAIIGLDLSGKVTSVLYDPTGQHYQSITSVEQIGDKLYLGSIIENHVGVIPVEAMHR